MLERGALIINARTESKLEPANGTCTHDSACFVSIEYCLLLALCSSQRSVNHRVRFESSSWKLAESFILDPANATPPLQPTFSTADYTGIQENPTAYQPLFSYSERVISRPSKRLFLQRARSAVPPVAQRALGSLPNPALAPLALRNSVSGTRIIIAGGFAIKQGRAHGWDFIMDI